jgi:hypothetical protein
MIGQKLTLRYLGLVSFLFAIILGVIVSLLRAVPDLEATMFGFAKYGYPHLSSLACPPLMTSSDREAVTIKLDNKLDRPLTWYVAAQFSAHSLINSVEGNVELQPGESRVLSWDVGQENVSLGNFILARVYTSGASQGMKEGFCGTFVIDLPFTGGPTIYYAAMVLTAICLGLGLWLWRRNTLLSESALISQFNWMRLSALSVVLAVVTGFMDWWFLAILCVILIILATVVVLIPRKI